MSSEEKRILLIELCARLPYGVNLYNKDTKFSVSFSSFAPIPSETPLSLFKRIIEDNWIPYLRPMSSMTEEEGDTFEWYYEHGEYIGLVDWLNSHHFDYRGLIEKGLALEAPEGMYKTE